MDHKSITIRTAFNNIFKAKRCRKWPPDVAADESADAATVQSAAEYQDDEETADGLLVTSAAEAVSTDDEELESRSRSPYAHRALPPVPAMDSDSDSDEDVRRKKILDYAASIEKVKDCGWYWGPVSGSAAEKLLTSEPEGSFIVRDSSNENYIFSLSFKLDGCVRHVRIEQDQGNFSFGCLHKFRSNTIVDFIEDAVLHSRSGRFLFFLHRSPAVVPMRVQLLHPVSRFKQIQSLQHMCRFVLLKCVRRDLIGQLPLPTKLRSYLNTPHYYSEDAS